MFHSNTDHRLHEICAENEELKQLLSDYNDQMRLLLSQITHEIRNPLTLMYSTLQLIESRNPDVKQISYWPTLTEDMKDIFSLLENLSDFNHSDFLHKTETNLLTLLTDLKISFEPLAKEKNILLSIVLTDQQLHPIIASYCCDAIKLKQVYTNLIKNAIEATNLDGQIQIMFKKEQWNKKSFLCISIANTGSTIAKEDLDSIFMPFTTTKETGSGLGLPTSKRIIISHGGDIVVTSNEHTTTFSTYLPLPS